MIYLYSTDYIYKIHQNNIDYLLNKYDFMKLIIINDEEDMYQYIRNNGILHKKNIYICELEINTLGRLTYINHTNNMFLLNIKDLSNCNYNEYSYVVNYNITIFDYNSKYNCKNFVQIYNENNNKDDNNINFNKINDIAIIGNLNDNYINSIYTKLKCNNINVDLINAYNNINLFNYKIILNINGTIDNVYLNNFIQNKIIIINNKDNTSNINNITNINNKYIENNILISNIDNINSNKYTIDINYDSIPLFAAFTLKNYNNVYNEIYRNIDDNENTNEYLKQIKIKTNENIFYEIEKEDKYGFIIVRHVNSERTNNYWIESYKSIRKNYNNKIIIIDDNSNYDFIKLEDNMKIYNCEIIQSEYKSRGEILGYYYFYKNKPFEKAVIIHDSVFINKYIDFDIYGDIKFLWHFESRWFSENAELNLINNITNRNDLKQYYHKRDLIHGCFGVQSVISYKFLYLLEEKYSLFNLLNIIKDRTERMNLERIFSLMCIHEDNTLIQNPSIFGIIHHYSKLPFDYSYENYICDKNNNNLNNIITKILTGR